MVLHSSGLYHHILLNSTNFLAKKTVYSRQSEMERWFLLKKLVQPLLHSEEKNVSSFCTNTVGPPSNYSLSLTSQYPPSVLLVVIKKVVLYPRISCASLSMPKAELHLPATYHSTSLQPS
jgi:hypothetical protein